MPPTAMVTADPAASALRPHTMCPVELHTLLTQTHVTPSSYGLIIY